MWQFSRILAEGARHMTLAYLAHVFLVLLVPAMKSSVHKTILRKCLGVTTIHLGDVFVSRSGRWYTVKDIVHGVHLVPQDKQHTYRKRRGTSPKFVENEPNLCLNNFVFHKNF